MPPLSSQFIGDLFYGGHTPEHIKHVLSTNMNDARLWEEAWYSAGGHELRAYVTQNVPAQLIHGFSSSSEVLSAAVKNALTPQRLMELLEVVVKPNVRTYGYTFRAGLEYNNSIKQDPKKFRHVLLAALTRETIRRPSGDDTVELIEEWRSFWVQIGILEPSTEDYAGSVQDIIKFLKRAALKQ